jgi:pimeloyl-ACP methyl ester carboxylesterase
MNQFAARVDEPVAQAFSSHRLRLNYVDWGNASAPTLLLVHGNEDHCRSWDWVAHHLGRDWHVVALDLRGHGDSEWSAGGDYSISSYVSDVAACVDHLGPAPVTLVGHSLGGSVCLRYAGAFPARVRSLVSIEGIGPSPQTLQERAAISAAEQMRHWLSERARLARQNEVRLESQAAAYRRLHQKNAHLSAEQAWHLTRHATRAHADGTVNWKFDYVVRSRLPHDLSLEQQASLWAAIDCPTLLIWGTRRLVSNPQQDGRLRHFRQARFAVVQGAGHWVHHDRLDEVIGLIGPHLAG